jgi:hypothetical protein
MAESNQFPIQVALVAHVENLSPSLEDVRDALQLQIRRDLGPIWGVYAEVTSYPKGAQSLPASSWMLHIIDDEKVLAQLVSQPDPDPRVAGVHLETQSGKPQAHVLVNKPGGDTAPGAVSQSKNGQAWSIVASHELVEMLVNPYCNRTAWRLVDRESSEVEFFALEIADPCESPGFEYSVSLDKQEIATAAAAERLDIQVSDFVYPSWFSRLGKAPYHHTHDVAGFRIDGPFQIGKGASVSVFSRKRGWVRRDSSNYDSEIPARVGAEFTLTDCPDWIGTDWIGT